LHRSIKIKALIVLFAWGIVFLHGVIPHIHINEQQGVCHSLIHDSDAAEQGDSDSDHLKGGHNDHEKVCHFSTTMLQQQAFDDLLAENSNKPQVIPAATILSVIFSDSENFLSGVEKGPSKLRPPPAV
jgi:hypothetical protein